MKKYISIALSLILAFAPVSAFAAENVDEAEKSIFIERMYQNTDSNELKQVASNKMVVREQGESSDTKNNFMLEMQLLNYYVIPIENIESTSIENEVLTFEGTQENGISIEGNISVLDNGTINLAVKEGEIENQVILTNDGKIYLDGNEVTFFVEIEKDNNKNSLEEYKDSIGVKRGSDQWQTTSCPYGKASDYSDYQFTAKVSDIRLGKAIELISDTVLTSVVLGMAASLEAETGLWGFVTPAIAYDVVNLLRDLGSLYDGTMENLSFKSKVYYHTKGHVVGNLLTVHKEKQTWYTEKNFGGDFSKMTVYSCQQYY